MTMTLGRVGTDIALADAEKWTRSGSTVTIEGVLGVGVTLLADRITLSEQVLGLANNPDEPFIACTWSQEAWFDGYYKVVGVNVDAPPTALTSGWFPYSITLERVADGASPTIDVSLLGALRTNGNSVTSGRAITWAPSAQTGGYAINGAFTTGLAYNQTGTGQSRTTETGAVISVMATGATAVTNGYASFDVLPANYYNGHCTIRSGTTLRRVIGSRMKTLPTNWELSNGLVRVTPTTLSRFILEVYDGAAWEETKVFHITNGVASSNILSLSSGWGDISVLRNSPECCAIRLRPSYPGGAGESPVYVDVSIQRGRMFVDVTAATLISSTSNDYGLGCATAEAATALTGGIRATSNDVAGNRYVLACSQATTNDLTQGHVRPTDVRASYLMMGYELGGSGAAAPNTAQNVIDEWYFPFEERMAPRTR